MPVLLLAAAPHDAAQDINFAQYSRDFLTVADLSAAAAQVLDRQDALQSLVDSAADTISSNARGPHRCCSR